MPFKHVGRSLLSLFHLKRVIIELAKQMFVQYNFIEILSWFANSTVVDYTIIAREISTAVDVCNCVCLILKKVRKSSKQKYVWICFFGPFTFPKVKLFAIGCSIDPFTVCNRDTLELFRVRFYSTNFHNLFFHRDLHIIFSIKNCFDSAYLWGLRCDDVDEWVFSDKYLNIAKFRYFISTNTPVRVFAKNTN